METSWLVLHSWPGEGGERRNGTEGRKEGEEKRGEERKERERREGGKEGKREKRGNGEEGEERERESVM